LSIKLEKLVKLEFVLYLMVSIFNNIQHTISLDKLPYKCVNHIHPVQRNVTNRNLFNNIFVEIQPQMKH